MRPVLTRHRRGAAYGPPATRRGGPVRPQVGSFFHGRLLVQVLRGGGRGKPAARASVTRWPLEGHGDALWHGKFGGVRRRRRWLRRMWAPPRTTSAAARGATGADHVDGDGLGRRLALPRPPSGARQALASGQQLARWSASGTPLQSSPVCSAPPARAPVPRCTDVAYAHGRIRHHLQAARIQSPAAGKAEGDAAGCPAGTRACVQPTCGAFAGAELEAGDARTPGGTAGRHAAAYVPRTRIMRDVRRCWQARPGLRYGGGSTYVATAAAVAAVQLAAGQVALVVYAEVVSCPASGRLWVMVGGAALIGTCSERTGNAQGGAAGV